MTIQEMLANGKDIIAIDPQALDQAWLRQSEHVYESMSSLADAKYQVAKKKAALDLLQAKMAKRVRLDPAKYDLSKVTVDAVNEAVLVSDEYQAANAALTEAYLIQNKLQALVDSLDHKKKALEALGYLYAQNFYSAPKTPQQRDEELDKIAERAKARREVPKGGSGTAPAKTKPRA